MSRPSDYRLIVPEAWFRIDLEPGSREPAIAHLVDQQFRGMENVPQLKHQARAQFLKMAQGAYANGGMELYVSLQTAAGLPLSASLVVTLTPLHRQEDMAVPPERLAEVLARRADEVTLASLPAGTAVRARRRISGPDDQPPVTSLDVHIPVPESSAYLVLSFSTPLAPLADAMVGLFDSISETLRWI
jgi:hypothetical protein